MLAEQRANALAPEPDKPGKAREERRSRAMLAKRVADVVCLPSSEITPQERHLAGDLLIEILLEGDADLRRRCARRVAALTEPPHRVLRLLARDEIEIARPILEESDALNDADLVDISGKGGREHRCAIAKRDHVSELVVEALIEDGDADVLRAALCNDGAQFSNKAIDTVVAASREQSELIDLVLRRPELCPSQGLAMFWWAGPAQRKQIFGRFAVSRRLLQEAAADVFAVAAGEGWQDHLSRKALQFIDRRQRNRLAIDKSPYGSLEEAVKDAANGMTRELVEEISYLSGVKPVTGAQIFTDLGGEPLAVLCKATGLKRPALALLWRGLKREGASLERPSEHFARVIATYDTLATEKAQTVLRYWNWALTSALSPELISAIQHGEEMDADRIGVAAQTAAWVFDF